jgi:hypothetical protein
MLDNACSMVCSRLHAGDIAMQYDAFKELSHCTIVGQLPDQRGDAQQRHFTELNAYQIENMLLCYSEEVADCDRVMTR